MWLCIIFAISTTKRTFARSILHHRSIKGYVTRVDYLRLGGAFGRFVQNKLGDLDIWRGSYSNARLSLRTSIDILERWTQCCETLTMQFWKRYAPHPWKSEKFVPENLPQLAARLTEVCVAFGLILAILLSNF